MIIISQFSVFFLFSLLCGNGNDIFGLRIGFVNGLINIPLQQSSYNYLIEYEFNSTSYEGVVDTRSELIIPMQPTTATPKGICISRQLDGTSMNYSSSISQSCAEVTGILQIEDQDLLVAVNVSLANHQYLANPKLHSWSNNTGIFGVNYPSSSDSTTTATTTPSPTSFQTLLLNSTNTTIFGLDFNSGDDSISSLQLGGVSEIYENKMQWSPLQSTSPADKHEAFINDLEFCGVSIFANWSRNWPIIVDTASVCLTLPSEYYQIFIAWFNTTINLNVNTLDDLPPLSFSLSSDVAADRLYIALSDLLVNTSDIIEEIVPQLIPIPKFSQNLSLCVLEGDLIYSSKRIGYNVPPIIFGSLTLRSLYFASRMDTQQIGFANKHESLSLNDQLKSQCQSAVECVGQYHPDKHFNVCVKPDCSRYYYVVFNSETGQCEYNNGAYVVGLLFITIITSCEIFTYFTSQYTFLERSYYTSPRFKPDFITQFVGAYLTIILEFLRNWLCGCAGNEDEIGTQAGQVNDDDDDNQNEDEEEVEEEDGEDESERRQRRQPRTQVRRRSLSDELDPFG